MHLRLAIILCLGFLWASASFADQVALTNGDRLTGTILRSDAKTLVIKSDLAGEVSVKWEAVVTVTSSQALHLLLKDGETLVGSVTTQDGKFLVATKDAGVVTASKDLVVALRNDDEQKTYDESTGRLRNPRLADLWNGQLDTGLSLTRGNSASVNYTLAAKAIRETTRDKITVNLAAIYGTNDSTTPSQTVAHEIRGGVRGDLNIKPRLFAFALTDFDSNALEHLDLQNDVGGGAGVHVVKSKTTTFDLIGGATYNQEYFSAYSLVNPAPPPATLPFAAVTRTNAETLWGEELDTKGGRTTFGENFTFYPGISGSGGYRFTFNSSAATKLNNWLGWQVTFSDNYLSNPPFGIKGNDLLLSTGLRLTMGKPTP